jgi:hypothetical protein
MMGWGRRWSARMQRRQARRWRLRLTWQACRRCGAYAFLPGGTKPICGSCRSLQ